MYYSELKDLAASGALKGKPVAVFGLGDQEGYGENFAVRKERGSRGGLCGKRGLRFS